MNGDIMTKKIKETMDKWKSGRFFPLTSRPWSVNTYALSKLWFRTGCIDIKEGDCKTMSSAIKSWVYQPNLAKPTECLLYCQVSEGGLGLYNNSCRAKANLIKSFLETACGLKFKVNLFHKAVFDHYVLEDTVLAP